MFKRINSFNVSAVLLAISIALLCYLSFIVKDTTIIITWVAGLCISFLIKDKTHKQVYLFSYSINSIFAILICINNYLNTGYLHSLFLDDKRFYETTLKLLEVNIEDYFNMSRLSVYYFITTKIYQFLDILGISSKSYFHFLNYNIVIGSFIPVLIFYLGGGLFKKRKTILEAAYFVSVFPTVIYFNSIGLRDVWATMFFLFFITVYIKYDCNLYKKWVFLFLLLTGIFLVRHQNILYPILFVIFYTFFNSKSKEIKRAIVVVSVLGVIIFLLSYSKSVEAYYNWYKNFSYQANSSNSLGLKFKYETGIIGKIIYLTYFIFGELPFLSFRKLSISNVILDIGSVLWFFVIPYYVFFSIKKINNSFVSSYFFTFIISCAIISQITGHLRHKSVFIPIILMLFYGFVTKIKQRDLKISFKKITIVYFIFGLIYLLAKTLWK